MTLNTEQPSTSFLMLLLERILYIEQLGQYIHTANI